MNNEYRKDEPAAAKQTGATNPSMTDDLHVDYTLRKTCEELFLNQDVAAGFPPVGTIADAAEFMQLKEPAVRELCRSGQLRAIKCGNLWRIPKSFLAEFIERGGSHD